MLDSDADVPLEVMQEYEKLLKKSYTENFDEFYKSDLLKLLGKDGYGCNIVLLIPCFVASTGLDAEKTLRYVIHRLDPVVKENYVLILCETHTNWMIDTVYIYAKQWYDVLPRKYKKNLKKLYLLHSGFVFKTVLTILSPFLSANFGKKIEYVQKLEDLFMKLNINPTYFLRQFPYIVQRNEEILMGKEPISFFGADIEIMCQRFGKQYMEFKNIPCIVVTFLEHLTKKEIISTKDLFHLQTDANTLYSIIGDIEYGEPSIDFNNIPALVSSFKLFLDVQRHGLLGKDAFAKLFQIKNNRSKKIIKYTLANLYSKLEPGTQQFVLCILKFLQRVSQSSAENNMTPDALSTIFAATFFRARKPYINFQECIPLANTCLKMLIIDPSILMTKITDIEDDGSSESISSDELKGEETKANEKPPTKKSSSTVSSSNSSSGSSSSSSSSSSESESKKNEKDKSKNKRTNADKNDSDANSSESGSSSTSGSKSASSSSSSSEKDKNKSANSTVKAVTKKKSSTSSTERIKKKDNKNDTANSSNSASGSSVSGSAESSEEESEEDSTKKKTDLKNDDDKNDKNLKTLSSDASDKNKTEIVKNKNEKKNITEKRNDSDDDDSENSEDEKNKKENKYEKEDDSKNKKEDSNTTDSENSSSKGDSSGSGSSSDNESSKDNNEIHHEKKVENNEKISLQKKNTMKESEETIVEQKKADPASHSEKTSTSDSGSSSDSGPDLKSESNSGSDSE